MAYNWLPALDMVGRLLREALWAPALIVLAAVAFCAFALACTTALAWEIGEFAVDRLAGAAACLVIIFWIGRRTS